MTHFLVLSAVLAASPPNGDAVRAAAERAAADLAGSLGALQDRERLKVLACPDFAEPAGLTGVGRLAAEAAATRLATASGLTVLDRAKLEALVGEQKLAAMMGTASAAAVPELARKTGAQATVLGRVEDASGKLMVSVRLVTPQGKTLAFASSAIGSAPSAAAPAAAAAAESPRVDVAMRKLADGLAAGFARLPGSTRYRRLAVLAFSEVGQESQRRQIGTIVTAEIATTLRRDHGLLLVERAKLKEVLGELKLQQMVGVEGSQAGKIGAMADAQALVIGSVADAGDRYLVNARIVATQSGETLAAESASVQAAGLVALASDAVVLRSRSGAVFRSILVPGFGQFYNRQPVKAWTVIGVEAALLGSALGFHLAGNSAYAEYRRVDASSGGSPSQRATDLYDTATSRYRTRNWLLLGGAAVWALNVVDAYASGVDGESLLGGGAVAGATPRLGPAVTVSQHGATVGLAARF